MIVTHKINVDLIQNPNTYESPVVRAYQCESETRVIELTLTENGVAWNVPPYAACVVKYMKPDGFGGVYSTLPDTTKAWSIDGNILSVTLAPQMVNVAGYIDAEVLLVWGEKTLVVTDVHVIVDRNPYIVNADSRNYFSFENMDEINTALTALFAKLGTDLTLSTAGQAADAAAVGSAVNTLMSEKPSTDYVKSVALSSRYPTDYGVEGLAVTEDNMDAVVGQGVYYTEMDSWCQTIVLASIWAVIQIQVNYSGNMRSRIKWGGNWSAWCYFTLL